MNDAQSPLFCDRCVKVLTPGRGDFYVVSIEAVADPAPPVFDEHDLTRDLRGEFNRLVSQLEEISERESMDQVYRHVIIYLCGACYRDWIEHPAG
jgi:hypothetical protein